MRHSGEYMRQVRDVEKPKLEPGQKSRRLSTDVRQRRHNVRELKEKFESTSPQDSEILPLMSLSNNNNNLNTSNSSSNGSNKRSGGRKNRNIKRRHTVGGTKDLTKVLAWQKALLQWPQLATGLKEARLQQQQQQSPINPSSITPEFLQQLLSFNCWEARERLGTSSPDLPQLLDLFIPSQDLQQHRRLSVREPWMLRPVLESHV